MSPEQALEFVARQGVVLASADGPLPNIAQFVAGTPVRGSWWSHPMGREIFRALRAIEESADVLRCRACAGKITFVHRRLWPALTRLAERFEPRDLAWIHQEHTASGAHRNRITAFPDWVPPGVAKEAERMAEAEAAIALGAWIPEKRP